jgi:probable DNA repair protein
MPVTEEIKRAFASGATILTANLRAARWLQLEYAMEQRRAGKRAWTTPAIENWNTWLRSLWQTITLAGADSPLLLTSLQERSVWARMQREDAALVVSPSSMAMLAESAYELLGEYNAHSERNHTWAKTDAESFRRWAANFDRECARRNWISRAGLETKVATLLDPKVLPERILLVGFERTVPAQEKLLHALANCGVSVEFDSSSMDAQTEFIRASGLREEITACALWARGLIQKYPDTRIGILVPDMNPMRGELERIFRRTLMPQADDLFVTRNMPFEFSLGQPLAHVPVIRAALLLLRWLHAPLREEELSWLLLSGFFSSSGTDHAAIARLDAKHRNSGSLSLEISLSDFLKRTELFRAPSLRKLEDARKAADANRITEEERLPGRWTDVAQSMLREVDWPGVTKRDTLHFQALRRWENLLDEIALLDFDGLRVSYEGFLSLLESHALETIFAPESQNAPVQIMGALEASGQQFDALWFLSADDASWPQRGRPHPLLPNEMQRRLQMPYGNAESDLKLAKSVTARIAASAPVVVFSHAERNQDGELRSSPLLPSDTAWQRAPASPVLLDHEAHPLDEIEDQTGSIAWPLDRSPGGSEVLKHQAACAFQAFATKRLRAEPLNRGHWGLSAAERGILLHKTLEKIWSPENGALHSLEDLQSAVREEKLDSILAAAIAEVFSQFETVDDIWMRAYLLSEQRRLQLRLEEWMRVEAARVPFKVIASEEKLNDVDVGGLKLKLRADRIDELENFDRLLIDYKTGEVSPRDWKLPRPNEPQLPLYAVFGNVEDVCGVLFASIRAEKTGFRGVVADLNSQLFANTKPTSALGNTPYTDKTRDEWQDALLALATDFLRGEAAVNPKYGKDTCKYCSLPGLCRVAEVRNLLEDKATEGSEDNE